MAPPLQQLLGSPDHYLHAFDGSEALFVPMDRAAYRRSIFLDHRISPAGQGGMRVPVVALADAPAPLPTHWIFHIAHCGSTLLARALEALGDGLVLREPLALRQLALEPEPGALLAPTLALLSRRYPGAGPTLIKANVPVNFMLPELVKADPQARAVFLFSTLPDYLCAVLRSDQHRNWVRGVAALLGGKLGQILPETDAELAAMLWHAQLCEFESALAKMKNARSLDFEVFLQRPDDSLLAAAKLYGCLADRPQVARIVAGPLFSTYSKNPEHAFDNATRLAQRNDIRKTLSPEIAQAQAWLANNTATGIDLAATLLSKNLLT